MRFLKNSLLSYAMLLILISATSLETPSLPAVGTQETIVQDPFIVEVVVQSPSAHATPLQIVCLFEYTEGDIFNSPPALPKELNGMVHIDEAFGGLITELRKTNPFKGKLLETLLLVPPSNTIPAKKLLLIGLGNRDTFDPQSMRLVGLTGMREALSLGVENYSHASDLKDAGFSSPTAAVTGYVIEGALEAFQTQLYLQKKNASSSPNFKKVTLRTIVDAIHENL